MNHPSVADLSLFAGGELGFVDRWRVNKHVQACESCRMEVDGFRASIGQLRMEADELPGGLRWDRLAAEMTANIHVGLEAAECVAPAREPRTAYRWRATALVAAMSAMVLVAWYLNPRPMVRPAEHALRAPRVEIRNTSTGLELNNNGSALVLLHGRGADAQRPIVQSSPGLLRARFVDGDTGQITINNVYAE